MPCPPRSTREPRRTGGDTLFKGGYASSRFSNDLANRPSATFSKRSELVSSSGD